MKTQTYPSFKEEELHWKDNKLVIGVDEVGRGAFAGPIVAAAVIYPLNFSYLNHSSLSLVNDSKMVKPTLRKSLSRDIKEASMYFAIAEVGVSMINKVGIGEANKMAFRKAIASVLSQAKKDNNSLFHLLADGFHVKFIREIGLKNQTAIIKGDQISFTIASASILAKVHRDNIMKKYHKTYPLYGFSKNKGYGTLVHREALREIGLTKIHRYDFCKNHASIC